MSTLSNTHRNQSEQEYPLHFDAEIGDHQLPPSCTSMDVSRPLRILDPQSGKIGWVLLWLIGIPLPVLAIAWLIWGR